MICPSCGDEYRPGFTKCGNCHVALVSEVPVVEEGPRRHPDLVTVYTTGNAAIIPVIESVLRDAGIEFVAKSEGLQDFFAWGRIGLGYNPILGPVEIQVTTDDQEAAEELLKEMESGDSAGA